MESLRLLRRRWLRSTTETLRRISFVVSTYLYEQFDDLWPRTFHRECITYDLQRAGFGLDNLFFDRFAADNCREELQSIMSIHLNRHMLIPDHSGCYLSDFEIRRKSFAEMLEFCRRNDLSALLVYLFNQWYRYSMWVLWTRSSYDTISLSRTNMLCESHFSYLKRNVLVNNNRPRLDFLFYTLVHRVMIDFSCKLDLRLNGRVLPRWIGEFRKEWREKYRLVSDAELRHTDPNQWTCSCRSFLLSRFFLCVHLIKLTPVDTDLSLVQRSTKYPLISFNCKTLAAAEVRSWRLSKTRIW